MVTVMKVIPYSLWEEMNKTGDLDSCFETEKADPIDTAVKTLPPALQDRAHKILTFLKQKNQLGWNAEGKLFLDAVHYPPPRLTKLLFGIITGSSEFKYQEWAKPFLRLFKRAGVPQDLYSKELDMNGKEEKRQFYENPIKPEWILFETVHQLVE